MRKPTKVKQSIDTAILTQTTMLVNLTVEELIELSNLIRDAIVSNDSEALKARYKELGLKVSLKNGLVVKR